MADYGLKIAREGKSTDSDDPNDYTLHSKYNTIKIAEEGIITGEFRPGSSDEYDVEGSVSHNLGYKPLVRVYARVDESGVWILAPAKHSTTTPDGPLTFYANFSHDSDNKMTFRAGSKPPTGDPDPSDNTYHITIKYYILIDPIKDTWYE